MEIQERVTHEGNIAESVENNPLLHLSEERRRVVNLQEESRRFCSSS